MTKLILSIVAAAMIVVPAAQAIPDLGSGADARAIQEAQSISMSPDDRAFSRVAADTTVNPLTTLRRADARQARADARVQAAKDATAVYGGSNNQRAPDFWNYDPNTGEKIANISPGLSSEELAAQYGMQPIVIDGGSGGFAWGNAGEGAAVGFGFALLLGGLALMIVRSRRAVPAV